MLFGGEIMKKIIASVFCAAVLLIGSTGAFAGEVNPYYGAIHCGKSAGPCPFA